MWAILWVLCGFGGFLGAAEAGNMEGGLEIGNATFPEVAFVQRGNSPPTTICLGTVFNSFTVFTAGFCEVTEATMDGHYVISAIHAFRSDLGKFQKKIVHVMDVIRANSSKPFSWKILRLELPGFRLGEEASTATILDDWRIFLDEFLRPSKQASVMAYGPPHKVASVKYNSSNAQNCNDSYTQMKLPEWPRYEPFEMFCIYPGTEPVVSYFLNSQQKTEIMAGTPCDDSVGSPVFVEANVDHIVIGMVLKAFCDGAEKVAFALAAPEFMVLDAVTGEPPSSEVTLPPPRTRAPVTQRRSTRGTGGPRTPAPTKKSSSSRLFSSLPLLSLAILYGTCEMM